MQRGRVSWIDSASAGGRVLISAIIASVSICSSASNHPVYIHILIKSRKGLGKRMKKTYGGENASFCIPDILEESSNHLHVDGTFILLCGS